MDKEIRTPSMGEVAILQSNPDLNLEAQIEDKFNSVSSPAELLTDLCFCRSQSIHVAGDPASGNLLQLI